jgi:hypothetical protein
MEFQKKAYDLRDRVSEKERLNIVATYHWTVTGNLDKEMEAEELGRQTYPRDGGWLNNLTECQHLGTVREPRTGQ